MPRRFTVQNSFSAVAPGQTATVDLSPTGKYHQLRLQYGTATVGGPTQANMEAEVTEIRVKVNGKGQRVFTAAELFTINAYHGVAVTDGFLPIMFSEPWKRTIVGEDQVGWGMADVETFQIEVDIAGGALSPTLSLTAVKDVVNIPMGPIVKWRRFQVPVSAIGVFNLTSLPKSDAYNALHCFSGNIDDVLVRVDQEDVFEAVLADVNEYYAQNGFAPQASMFHIDFQATARLADSLSMVRANDQLVSEYRIDFNMSAAVAFNMITETIGFRD